MKKHNTIKTLCLAALLLLGGMKASAQLQSGFEQSIYLNGALPMGTMAKHHDYPASYTGVQFLTKDHICENAALGFGAGYRAAYHFDVGFGQMAPFANVDFLWNQVRGAMREANTINNCKSTQYFNIPILLGLAYYYDGIDIFTPFAEAGLGYDILFVSAEGNKNALYYKYNLTNALAWQVGLGCYFGTHVSASVHYYGLGKHYATYKAEKCNPTVPAIVNTPEPRSLGQLMLRVGFHF